MKKSVLSNKWILIVDNQPWGLIVLEEQLRRVAPNCHVDRATHYKNAVELMASFTYDLIILDSLSFRSSDLLSRAVNRFPPSPVVLMTSLHLDSEALKGFVKIGVRICPPKENFGEMIPFLEDVVRHEDFPGWRRLLEDFTALFRGKIKTGWQGRGRFEMKSVGGAESIS